MNPSDLPRLDIRRSTEPGKLWKTVLLTDPVTKLGRLEDGEVGVCLEGERISRKHACIHLDQPAEEGPSHLKVHGQAGVRIYGRVLMSDESHALGHGYAFQIPGLLAAPDELSYLVTFRIDSKRTTFLALEFCPPATFLIFGEPIHLSGQGSALLAHLYQHKNELCYYADLMAAIWVPRPQAPEALRAYVERLYAESDLFSETKKPFDIVLSRLRNVIEQASGGLVFIETIRGEGLCLRV